MRIGNLDGRAVLITAAGAADVAVASDGRFGPDPQALYASWDSFTAWAAGQDLTALPAEPFTSEQLGSPAPAPGQLFAIGLNYREHVAEAGFATPSAARPAYPAVFTKFRSSITGPDTTVTLPGATVDWEVELVVVLGKAARNVPAAQAWDHVAGLTAGQDLSERTVQGLGPAPQFSLGKSFPGFTPMGPWLVTVDELRATGHDPDALALGCTVNGEAVQKGSTADLLFSVPALIETLSGALPLEAGDVIFTGTPSGVGMARKPPRFLAAGDELVTTIAGIGELRQRFV